MNIKLIEDYLNELIVVSVRLLDDESGEFSFNGCGCVAAYFCRLICLELRFWDALYSESFTGGVNTMVKGVLFECFAWVKPCFKKRKDGCVTRAELTYLSAGNKKIDLSLKLREKLSPYLRVQLGSIGRMEKLLHDGSPCLNFPYAFPGKDARLVQFCVAVYACDYVTGISDEKGLCDFVVSVFRLLNKKVPSRPDLLVKRVFGNKNRLRFLEVWKKDYMTNILKGK